MNYLVAKVTPSDVTVIIDGKHKRIRKDSPDAELVIALVKQYNSSNVLEERQDIITKIEELCNPAKKIEFNSDGRFEILAKKYKCNVYFFFLCAWFLYQSNLSSVIFSL